MARLARGPSAAARQAILTFLLFRDLKMVVEGRGGYRTYPRGGQTFGKRARRKILPLLECFCPPVGGATNTPGGGQFFLVALCHDHYALSGSK